MTFQEWFNTSKYKDLNQLEITNIELLSCNSNQLTDLKGIEKLTNLEILYCNGNQLTDLKGIENLTNLKVLNWDNNIPMLKSMTLYQIKKHLKEINNKTLRKMNESKYIKSFDKF